MTEKDSSVKFEEMVFLTLFAAFFASRLSALEQIGLTLGKNYLSVLVFVGYNLFFLGSFHQVGKLLSKEGKWPYKIGYHLFAIVQGFAPYTALQASWWVEYLLNGLREGLKVQPEDYTLSLTIMYFLIFAVAPLFVRGIGRFRSR